MISNPVEIRLSRRNNDRDLRSIITWNRSAAFPWRETRSVANARGNLIAFIDDDEFPDDDWLMNHLRTLLAAKADGILGPVKPHFDGEAPAWLVRSGLLERSSLKTNQVLPDSSWCAHGQCVLIWKYIF